MSNNLDSDSCPPPFRLLEPERAVNTPFIICFHGTGESCAPCWDAIASLLKKSYRVLLCDRGSDNLTVEKFQSDLNEVLKAYPSPYVLIAHSYGGNFARYFLHTRLKDIAGTVLVETGQERVWDPAIVQRQYSRRILGARPLSVIRGNSLIANTKALAEETNNAFVDQQREMLGKMDAEDEKLKKAQLALSSNHRYVHLPDCGHHVIRVRPDAVVAEVEWAMANLNSSEKSGSSEFGKLLQSLGARMRGFAPQTS